ncbi:cytosine-specific methyltransferase [Paramecium bursaria Chlorella virus NE-JV-1]|nr:cytosine-specific methyltransferase [Paramecium bursaria Chlorella virus NE-JV-1]
MAPLKALDLFSGIGGIGYALRGIVEPVAHVERDALAREFLKRKYPDIPVYDDVCTFDASDLSLDLIAGGFPCTGFSPSGSGLGFDHHASGLFSEMVRMLKESKAKFMFLENSCTLAQVKNLNTIVAAFNELGYDCRWTTCHASTTGAPHDRHRWFCLANRRDVAVDFEIPEVEKFDWTKDEPPRQIEFDSPKNKEIAARMGNAVVPDQVRLAMTNLRNMVVDPENDKLAKANAVRIAHGYTHEGKMYEKDIEYYKQPPLNIVLRQETHPEKHNARTPHVKEITKRFFATPMYSACTSHSRILTKRGSGNLALQVALIEGGKWGWRLNGDFTRYMMGYPSDYFKYYDDIFAEREAKKE